MPKKFTENRKTAEQFGKIIAKLFDEKIEVIYTRTLEGRKRLQMEKIKQLQTAAVTTQERYDSLWL